MFKSLARAGDDYGAGRSPVSHFDRADLIGGILLILAGVGITTVSVINYPLGTVSRMGPGMFPAGLGVILAFLGLLLTIQSMGGPGEPLDIRVISPLFVLGGIAAFALTIKPFGMVPAILAGTIISSIAELQFRPMALLWLCLGLCSMIPFVFIFLLGLNVPLFGWPF